MQTVHAHLRQIIAALGVAGLASCMTTGSESFNIHTYAPVIDVKGQGYDIVQYHQDIEECRDLGLKMQAIYEEQREKELGNAAASAAAGLVLGAITGQVIANNNDVHSGRALTTGALYGAAIGASIGGDAIDYDRAFTKFGPTGVVDRCMKDRGYKILSAEGYGGG